MSKISITITYNSVVVPNKKVTLYSNSHEILGINYTNGLGVVLFNCPIADVGASIKVDSLGTSSQFNLPGLGGQFAATVDFPGNVQQVSVGDAWTLTANRAPTGSVTITGTATVGSTLTAANTLADADGIGVISYQWKEDGINIVGATGSTFVLTSAQLGKVITVSGSYTDSNSFNQSVVSTGTAAVS